jgi:hypothetical protein
MEALQIWSQVYFKTVKYTRALALAKNDPFVLVKSDHTKSTLGSGFGARQTRMKIY